MSTITDYTKNLEAKDVFAWFEKLCAIPHGSRNEKELSDYLYNYAKNKGFEVHQDELFNLVIKKDATSDALAKKAPIIIQSHIDMVLNPPEAFVDKNPIELSITDGWIHSNGTTIGADNGIGAAFSLALLDSTTIAHPPLEVVLTTQEEVGLGGAIAFDASILKGTTIINTDSEGEGIFFVSCCGGSTLNVSLPSEYTNVPTDYSAYTLTVEGLQGGHSGLEIDKERGNANRFLTRILYTLKDTHDFYVQDIKGGIAGNAISSECYTTVFVKESDVSSINKVIEECKDIFTKEIAYNVKDGEEKANLSITFEKTGAESKEVLAKESCNKLLTFLTIVPHGVLTSDRINAIPESSVNFAMIKTSNDAIEVVLSIRSTLTSKKKFYQSQIIEMATLLGAKVEVNGEYPGWAYEQKSSIRELYTQAYKNIFGQDKNPELVAIHAGLECGLFVEKFEALGKKCDIFTFGPNIDGAHTINEKVEVQSVENSWKFFLEGIRLLGE